MNLKRIIAVLSAMITVSSLSITVCALRPNEEVIEDLYKFKIIADTSDIRPDDKLTRAEAIKMLCIAEGNDGSGVDKSYEQIFTDVPINHWAAKYIQIGYYENIIHGYEDNTFQPERNVTYNELQKMIVSTLGFDIYAENAGGYPNGYSLYANNLGITKDLSFDDNSYVTRGDAMQMIYNFLDAPIMVTQRMFKDGVETDPLVKLYDGGNYPFKSYRMILNGEAALE